ncbi:MAG TPA: DNA (cytosine-5-)-methyltransferase [Gemmatimonadaceae bacterium]
MTRPPTFGSLFAGIGGLDLGLERAGWECRWQVEIDDYCRRVLAKHWPAVPKYGDIRDLSGEELERVDLIAGGFPCQDISNAGRRAGIAGERSGLWGEFARLIRVLRPRFVLVENVESLALRGLERVLGDLALLGYDAEWSLLSACALGAPHTRERLFILAYPQGGREGQLWRLQRAQGREAARDVPWAAGEPGIHRVADGVPARVDRLRGLGNAVVPQVAEFIGRRLLAASEREEGAA